MLTLADLRKYTGTDDPSLSGGTSEEALVNEQKSGGDGSGGGGKLGEVMAGQDTCAPLVGYAGDKAGRDITKSEQTGEQRREGGVSGTSGQGDTGGSTGSKDLGGTGVKVAADLTGGAAESAAYGGMLSNRSPIHIAPVGVNLGAIIAPFSQGPPENGGSGLDLASRFIQGATGRTITPMTTPAKAPFPWTVIAIAGGGVAALFIFMKFRR